MDEKSQFSKINLHIHSIYSDGRDSIEMIVNKAIKLQFNYIAITDHFSNAWKSDIIKTLNSYKKINLYLKKIETQNQKLSNRGSQLRILKGIEIDLGSSQNYIEKLIDPSKFDLILFEYLESPESIGFINNLIQKWKEKIHNKKELPILGLAHFDPSHFIYGNINSLLSFLEENSIYYEFNSAYSSYYSSKYKELFFDKLKSHRIPVGIGADSHSISELHLIGEPLEMIQYYGLEQNFELLVDKLQDLNSS